MPKQIMATHNEATWKERGGDGALCAGDALGEEDIEPRERQERQDRGTNVGRLERIRELPLGINPGER